MNKELLLTLTSHSEPQTKQIAAAVARHCAPGDCVLLSGDLGTGKTAFARGFVQALAGNAEDVTSPTFTLMQSYQAQSGQTLWHFDLYRLKSPDELDQLGMDEALSNGISLVEWPEIAEKRLPPGALTVQLQHAGDAARTLTFRGDAATWKPRLAELK